MEKSFLQQLGEAAERVRNQRPLVHQITNYVTVNDCANIVLAAGASPVMADAREEVEEMAGLASALVLNIGTLNERTVASMLAAAAIANNKGIPVILDPVGAGATLFRTETSRKLLAEVKFAAIRGNISEIKTLVSGEGSTRGVDADTSDLALGDGVASARQLARRLASQTGGVVVISGAVDVAATAEETWLIDNGHPMMAAVTGTGCMGTALIGAFCGANPDFLQATVAAMVTMGIAGEHAYADTIRMQGGSGSFKTFLIDAVNRMNGATLQNEGKIHRG